MRSILILMLTLGAANAAAAAQGVASSLRPRNPINRVIPWDQTATTSNAALPECGFAAETNQSTNIQPCDPRNVYLTR